MATVLVNDVVERVNYILNDILSLRWKDDDLIALLDEAQLAVVARRPDAGAKNAGFQCQANSRQNLPDDGLRLLNVYANTVSGAAITHISVDLLNEQVPNWRKGNALAPLVQHFVYDDRDPKHFYVYPAPVANHMIDIVYSATPQRVASKGAELTLDDIYFNPLCDYMLYRAFDRDVENQANAIRAARYFDAFRAGLGEKTQGDTASSPNNA